MAEERISSIADLAALEKEKATLEAWLSGIAKQIADLNKTGITIETKLTGSNNLKDIINNSQLLVDVQGKLISTAKDYQVVQNGVAQATAQYKAVLSTATADVSAYTGSIKTNSEALATSKLKIENATAQLKALKKEFNEGSISAGEYRKKAGELFAAQQKLKLSSAEVTSTLKAQTKETLAETGSIDELSHKLFLLKDTYRQLSAEMRNSPFGQTLQRDIAGLDVQVKGLDKTIGNSQRNVGNYESVFTKAYSGIRKLAYILPGIGIAGIFGLITEGLEGAGKAFINYITGSEKVNEANKLMGEIAKGSAGGFNQQAVAMEVLKKRFEDVTASEADKKSVVDELNKSYESQIGHINGINDAEKFFRDKSSDFIQALQLRAKAAGALSVIQQNFQKDIEESANPTATLSNFQKILAGAGAFGDAITTFNSKGIGTKFAENFNKALDNAGKTNAGSNIYNRALAGEAAIKILIKANEEAEKLDQKNKFNTDNKGKALPKTAVTDTDNEQSRLQALKERNLQALADQKFEQEQIIRNNETIFQDTTQSLDDRLAAYQKYEAARKQLLLVTSGVEVLNNLDRLEAIEKQESDYQAGRIKMSEYDHETLLINLENAKNAENAINKKAEADNNDIIQDGVQARLRIIKQSGVSEVDAVISGLNKTKIFRKKAYDEEKEALRSKGLSKKALAEAEAELDLKFGQQVLDDQIENVGEAIKLLKAEGVDVQKLIGLYDELVLRKKSTTTFKPFFSRDQITEIDAYTNAAISSIEAVNKILSIQSKIRLDAIDHEINAIDKHTQAEIDAANASVGTQDEKARKVAEINARAAAKKEALDQKAKQEQRKAAEREKAITIAIMVIQTALAVIKAINSAPYPANIPLAIAAGAAGAAQIAVAAATPIPSYEKGTGDHPGGPAWVSDANRSDKREVAILPSGETFLTPKQKTLMNLPKGTQVIPSIEQYMKMTYGMTMQGMGVTKRHDEYTGENVANEIDKMRRELVTAIREAEPVSLHGVSSRYQNYYYKNVKS